MLGKSILLKCCEDTKKPDLVWLSKCIYLWQIPKIFLEDFLSFIHHKEGDCHDDINDEESQNSWNPRLKHVKTIAKQSWSKGC